MCPTGTAVEPTVHLGTRPQTLGPWAPAAPRKCLAPASQVAEPTPAHRCPQLPFSICWRRSYLRHFIISHKSPGIRV